MDPCHFKLRSISAAIAATALTAGSSIAYSQNPNKSDTNLYRETQFSTTNRRHFVGEIDATTPRNIGGFSDSDLTDALRRIAGVSIKMIDGKKEAVAVRGIDPKFNVVTLNGRLLPGTDARAFDVDLLAPEHLSAIEVHKNGRADFSTGNIGATIGLTTARPLESDGLNMRLGTKLIKDTTHSSGDDLTPEISGALSWSNDTRSWGMALSASHKKLTGASVSSAVNQWDTRRWIALGEEGAMDVSPMGVNHDPQVGQLYSVPEDVRYIRSYEERVRNSTLFTLQHQPHERIVATLDYAFAENKLQESHAEQMLTFTHSADFMTFDTDQPVATPVFYTEKIDGVKDIGFSQRHHNQADAFASLGLNLAYEMNDRFSLVLDVHDSKAESRPKGPNGTSHLTHKVGASIVSEQGAEFRADVPGMYIAVDDSALPNPNGLLEANDLVLHAINTFRSTATTDIQQGQLNGILELEETAVRFGIESRLSSSRTLHFNHQYALDGAANPGDIPEALISSLNFSAEFKDYNTERTWPTGFSLDPVQLSAWAEEYYGLDASEKKPWDADFLVEEDIRAIFAQLDRHGNFFGMETRIVAGLRYEDTEFSSTARFRTPNFFTWSSSSHFQESRSDRHRATKVTPRYDHFLPDIHFSIHLREDLRAHISYSKTVARAPSAYLQPSIPDLSISGPSQPGAIIATGYLGGTKLLPLASDNLDLSLSWYFDDASYFSIDYFEKRLNNTINPLVQPSTDLPVNYGDAVIDGFELAVQHLFGDTGFGVQGNYTFINSDRRFDNSSLENQFIFTGLGDTANVIFSYENDGFQTRLTYNWHDQYLNTVNQRQNEPVYYAEHERVDVNISYALLDSLEIIFEGLNITGENVHSFGRSPRQVWNLREQGPRYQVGLRYSY